MNTKVLPATGTSATAEVGKDSRNAGAPSTEVLDEAKDEVEVTNQPAFDLAALLPPSEFAAPEGDRNPIAVLKHKNCRRFKVGDFIFKDYHLRIYTEEEAIAWSKVFPNLDVQDRSSIVTVNAQALAASETPYKPKEIQRGALSTNLIKDPKTVQ